MSPLIAGRASRFFEGLMAGDPVAIVIAIAVVGCIAFSMYRKYGRMNSVTE